MKIRTLMMSAAFALVAGPVLAADAPPPPSPPMLVRGTITAIDASSITIKKADGTSVTGAILPATVYAAVEPRRLEYDSCGATQPAGAFVRL